MKVVILAGGMGTRLAEETEKIPKPMVLIGKYPILWHIMSIYALQGFHDFTIATGYKGECIESWLASDEFIELARPFGINAVARNTGLETQTGGRIQQILEDSPSDPILLTYGDGLANVDLDALIKSHRKSKVAATLTAVRPPARFGYVEFDGDRVVGFSEKHQSNEGWINGGFFVLEPDVRAFISHPLEPFETGALTRLAELNQLNAYQHQGYWQAMDTLREKRDIEALYDQGLSPWILKK